VHTLTQRVTPNSHGLWGVTFILVILILGQSLPQRTHASSNMALTGTKTSTGLSESANSNGHCDPVSMQASTMKKSKVTSEQVHEPMMTNHTSRASSHASSGNISADCCGEDCQCPPSLCGSTIAYIPARVLPAASLSSATHFGFLTGTPVAATSSQFRPPKHANLV